MLASVLHDASCGWRARRLTRPHYCDSCVLPWSRAGATRLNRTTLLQMHRLPPDVLNVVTQLLGVKELGRCSRASRILATAAVFGFEARAQERGPGLVLHARHAQRQWGGEPDWRKLCRKAMSLNRRRLRPPAPRRFKSVDPTKAIRQANQRYMFTLEAFDGHPRARGTTCLLANRCVLAIFVQSPLGEQVSVDCGFPDSLQRDRIAFMRVLISRGADRLAKTAVLYSGAATGEETSAGARWFECYKPPWVDLDDDADESDVEDVVGNGVEALVWRSMLGPGCGVYFKKRMNQDGGDTFMPLNEVLFRLEHLLVFD